MKNRIEDLRNHLFAQLEKVMDCEYKELDDECQRSTTLIELAKIIVDTGRSELEFIATMENVGKAVGYENGFFGNQKQLSEK